MTLTTRLSVFFLAMLAFVLVGFSVTLYFLARDNFYHESEEHLEGAVRALTSAVNVDSDGVRWLPAQRDLNLASVEAWGQLLWIVRDDHGRIVDHSNQPRVAEFPIPESNQSTANSKDGESVKWQGTNWLVRQSDVRSQARDKATDDSEPEDPNAAQKYDTLSITAAISLEAAKQTLLRLATMLVILSFAIWTAALCLGRAVCRRALLPLTHMATAAGEIDATAFERRLPISSTRDELHDLGQTFNSLLDRLQESFERQKRFTSDASHQLRTPLTAILGQTEVALRRDRPVEEYQRVLRNIQQGANRLRAIMESLLYLARTDREAMLPDTEEVDLRDWLILHLQSWENHPRFHDIVLEATDQSSCRVKLHSVLAGELVNLLIDNACKYSQPATTIHVRVERETSVTRLLVQDHGMGIQEQDLEKIFVPFFRASQARDRVVEGVGLGLAIAQRLAATFDASLTVTSRIGAGSCFILTFAATFPQNADIVAVPQ